MQEQDAKQYSHHAIITLVVFVIVIVGLVIYLQREHSEITFAKPRVWREEAIHGSGGIAHQRWSISNGNTGPVLVSVFAGVGLKTNTATGFGLNPRSVESVYIDAPIDSGLEGWVRVEFRQASYFQSNYNPLERVREYVKVLIGGNRFFFDAPGAQGKAVIVITNINY